MKRSLVCCLMLLVAACSPAQRQASDLLDAPPLQDGGAMSCRLDLGASKRYLRLYWGEGYAGAKAVNPDENKETEFWMLNQNRFLNISNGQRRELGTISSAIEGASQILGFLFANIPAKIKADIDSVVDEVASVADMPVTMVMQIAPNWAGSRWHLSQGLSFGEGSSKLILPKDWRGVAKRAPFLLEAGTDNLTSSARKNGALVSATWENGAEKATLMCDSISELGPDFLHTKIAELEAVPLAGTSQGLDVASPLMSSLVRHLTENGKAEALAHILIGTACYPTFTVWQKKIPEDVKLSRAEKAQLAEQIRNDFFKELSNQKYAPWLEYIEKAGGQDPKQILLSAGKSMCVDSYIRALDERDAVSAGGEVL